jgi:hypothetical protein
MVGIIIKVVIGLVLFAGSLVGGLAATGRLNHEGTANIPVLSSFFPEPPAEEGGEGEGEAGDGHDANASHAAPAGETSAADGSHTGGDGTATDAAHGPQGPTSSRSITGPSVENPVEVAADPHGGGHGDAPADDGHGAGDGHGADAAHATGAPVNHGAPPNAGGHSDKTAAEQDFDNMESALKSQGRISYSPGAFFVFQGMPSGMTPEQVNEAWQRVQGLMQTIEQRNTALDLREAEIQELGEDISKRWKTISNERAKIEQMHSDLRTKIAKFEQTVKLVRNDEVQKLKNTATTLASFERKKAAELVQQQWGTERGQGEILRVLEFMDKEAVNEILAELPNAMIQDVLEQRMQISKEPKPPVGRD